MVETHGIDNPYHYSFKICANALNKNSNSVYSSYLNASTTPAFHCDNCDRSFKNNAQLEAHIKEHVVCNTNGCQFTAHPKIISAHVRMQHHSGIFNKIKKLDNPEEVQKWLAERKRKYPTINNIANKEKLNIEKRRRGEVIEPSNERFNKSFNGKFGKRKRKPKHKKRPEEPKIKSAENICLVETSKQNGNLSEFSGTGSIRQEMDELDAAMQFHISDEDESESNRRTPSDDIHPVNKSLALLMASYDSDEDSDSGNGDCLHHPPSVNPVKPITNPLTEIDDGEPPEEVKNITSVPDTSCNNLKRFPKSKKRDPKRLLKNNFSSSMSVRKRKPTLLQKLLEKQIVHERNTILHCINFVVQNNFFEKTNVKSSTIIVEEESTNEHIVSSKPTLKSKHSEKVRRMKPNKKPFLLRGLLKDEILKEQNIILQCIRYLVKSSCPR